MDYFESERLEVLESVLDALALPGPDGDRDAACRQLRRAWRCPAPTPEPGRAGPSVACRTTA